MTYTRNEIKNFYQPFRNKKDYKGILNSCMPTNQITDEMDIFLNTKY